MKGRVPAHGRRQPVRMVALLGAGLALRVLAEVVRDGAATAVALAGFAALLAFIAANVHLPGTPVIAVGVALNALVMAANGAMPVEPDAAVRSGIASADEITEVEWHGPRRLARSDDRLRALDDRIAVAAVGQVVSVGDVITLLGLGHFGIHLARRALRPVPPAGP